MKKITLSDICLFLLVFVLGCGVYLLLLRPTELTEEQYSSCERIAQELYLKEDATAEDVPRGFIALEIWDGSITVRPASINYHGSVTVTEQDGSIVATRNPENTVVILKAFLTGFLFVLVASFLWLRNKIQKKFL